MSNFFDLVGFEYKKIFKRKGAVISLVIVIFLAIVISMLEVFVGNVYIDGEFFETHYQSMVKSRDYARALSGRYIDENLISEAKEGYSKIPLVDNNVNYASYVSIPEYQEYGRPYSDIYYVVYNVYGSDFRLLQNLTQEHIENLYQNRHQKVTDEINTMKISDTSKDKLIVLDSEIQTPFLFSYIGGYSAFFSRLYSVGVFVGFVIAICLAPMFAGEYGTRTDQLILSSKFGKNKVITAKLFTGISFCAIVCTALTIIIYLGCGIVYGFDGANAPIQLYYIYSVYPMTILQVAIVYSICVFLAAIMVGSITLLLSSIFKSPFGVIIIMSLLIFVPMMFSVPENNILLRNLFRLLPSNMMWIAMSLIDYLPYELFGLTIPPYIFMPLFAVISTGVTLPGTWRAFKHHQIG